MNQPPGPERYFLTKAQRHALWQNEIAMFVVLGLPVAVASFWYGSTIRMVDLAGRVIAPALVGRGIGLALLISLAIIFGGALYLFVQPAVERVHNAQPIRGNRRLAYASFDGLLVGLITWQSLPYVPLNDQTLSAAISAVVGVLAGLIALAALLSMIDIPRDRTAINAWRAAREDPRRAQ